MVEAAADLPQGPARALSSWLLCVADSKRLLGIRYGEWCTGAPELEADIAATAMAQYELGHARLLYGLLPDFPENPRSPERLSSVSGYRHLPNLDRPFRDWTDFVVANAVVDTALTVALEAAIESRLRPLAQRLRKAVEEEEYHFLHGEAWLLRLAQSEDSRAVLTDRLEAAWPPVLLWFGPVEEGHLALLASEGLLGAEPAALRQRLLERLAEPLSRSGLPQVEPDSPSWDGWNEETRRRGAVELDPTTLELLMKAEAGEFEDGSSE